jgi:outer membrane protein assembly factor BamB
VTAAGWAFVARAVLRLPLPIFAARVAASHQPARLTRLATVPGVVSSAGDAGQGVRRPGPVRWERDFEAGLTWPPTPAGGWLLVGDRAGRLHALDAGDGRSRWIAEFGRISSPVAVADGTVYVGIADERVAACDLQTGRVAWCTDPLRTPAGHDSASAAEFPTVVDDLVLCRTWEQIHALERGSGRLRWSADGYTNAGYHPPVAAAGLVVHATSVASTDDVTSWVTAVDPADGEEVWTYEGGEDPTWTHRGAGPVTRQVVPVRPAAVGDRLYTFELIGPDCTDEHWLAADDAPAEQPVPTDEPACWLVELEAATGRWLRSIALPLGMVSSCEAPAVHLGVLWFSACRWAGTFDAAPTGGVLCRADLAAGRSEVVADLDDQPYGPPVIAGAVLYQATVGGVLQAFDTTTGRELWRWPTAVTSDGNSFGHEQPFAAGDGLVYVLTRTGLAALAEGPTPPRPPDATPR